VTAPADHRDFGRYFRSSSAKVLGPGVSDQACANVRHALYRLDLHSAGLVFSTDYDAALQADVRRFQTKHRHSSVDGICGPGTQALLVSALLAEAGPGVFERMHDPQNRREGQAFASYARADLNRVLPFIEMMRGWGYHVWYDDGIAAGSVWSDELRAEIDRSYLVLAFLSSTSVLREWVLKEITHASSNGKPVLPIMLDELPRNHELASTLARYQHLSANAVSCETLNEDLKARLAQALREAHAKRPTNNTPPPPPPIRSR
jgi:hypothetical protein